MPDEENELDGWIGWLSHEHGPDKVRAAANTRSQPHRPTKRLRRSFSGYTEAIDEIANTLHKKGSTSPHKDALAEALELEKQEMIERAREAEQKGEHVPDWYRNGRAPRMDLKTMEAYYRKGARELRDVDLRIAQSVAVLTAHFKVTDPVEARALAVAEVAGQMGSTPWIIERRLDRARKKHRS